MRCLFLCRNFPDVGTHLRAAAFVRIFREAGHLVTFMATSPLKKYRPERHLTPDGDEILTPNWAPLLDPQDGWSPAELFWRLFYLIQNRAFDLVYCFDHKPTTAGIARGLQRIAGTPVLYDWCDWWGGPEGLYRGYVEHCADFRERPLAQRWAQSLQFRLEEPMERRAPRRFEATTVISEALRQRCRDLGVDARAVEKVYTPCDLERFEPRPRQEARARVTTRFATPPEFFGGPVVFYAAHVLYDATGFWDQVETALARHPEVRFLLVGPPFLRHPDWLNGDDAGRRIVRTGFVASEDLRDLFAAADLFWLPLDSTDYDRGRFPHKFFDYLASGRPILASDVGDTPHLVRAHDVGLVARGGDDLADLLRRAMQARPRWEEWGRRARETAEREFDADSARRRLNLLLGRTLGDRTTHAGEPYRI